ncbi:hypothetical protein D3C80_769180 [compost metagenome]
MLLQALDGLAAVAADFDDRALVFQRAGQGEDVAHVVVHQQHLAALEYLVAAARGLEHALALVGQLRLDLVQEQRHFVEQALRRAGALDDDRARVLEQVGFFFAGQVAPGIHDHRREGADVLGGHALEQLVAEHVRQLEVDDHAVVDVLAQQRQGVLGHGHGGDLDIVVADQAGNAFALQVVVFHQQDVLELLGQLGLQAGEHFLELFAAGGLDRVADGAHVHGSLDPVLHGNDMHRDVPGARLLLQALQHGQAGMVGQAHVQQDGIGDVLGGQLEALVGALRHQAAVTQLVGQVEEDAGEVRFVLDHQDAAVAERRALAVVGKHRCLAFRRRHRRCLRRGWQAVDRRAQAERLDILRHALIALRQDQAEHAALAGAAVDADLPTQQVRQVAGNGQAQAGAAITAVAGAIHLVEGAEDRLLLVGGDADAGIAHGKDDAGARLVTDVQADLAALGELDGVGQQVLEDLLQALAVGEQSGRHLCLGGHLEGQALVPGQRLEHATQAFDQALHLGAFGAHFELAGFHLGDVENVVDQVEQVVAGRVDGFGELDLLVAEVALAVLRQQLGQDQRTVQWRAQLVGHVGEELGLVLARTLQFLGARLQLVLGLEQFVVLAVQRLGALGQLLVGLLQFRLLGFQMGLGLLEHAGLLFELFVGGFQLFLLHLQLFVQLLGLGQHFLQALPVAGAFDGDAEVATDPLQHLFVTLLQRPQEAQFEHAVDLPVVARRHQHGTAR